MSWTGGDDPDSSPYEEWDESLVRQRPNPKANRPRSKLRPEHESARAGMVLAVDRGRYTVLLDGAEGVRISAARARELGRQSIVPGDRVDLVGELSGQEGTLARVVRVQERRTLLRRSADDTDTVERIIVANADQLLMVLSATDPTPRSRLVDRYLVAAFDAGITPILCMTKTDLADPSAFLAEFDCLELEVFTSGTDAVPVEALRSRLSGHTTVLVGHSGVGKSTLVNALVPGTDRATGVVNATTGRGRHTSSSSVCLELSDAAGDRGWIVDTPGVRSFGLGHVNPENVIRAFANLARPAGEEELALGAEAVGEAGAGIPLAQAHDWEIIARVEAGELGESGKERIASMQDLLATIG